MDNGMLDRNTDIFCQAPAIILKETVDPVGLTHPVVTVPTEPAFATGGNLVDGNAFAHLEALCIFTGISDCTDEFMAGDKGRFHPGRLGIVTPEHSGAMPAFQVTGADAAAFGPDQNIIWTAFGDGIVFFKPEIVGAVCNKRLHCMGNGHLVSSFTSFIIQ